MNMVKKFTETAALTPEQGVVIARVINASTYPHNFNYLTLTPKNVYEEEENKFQRLTSIKDLPNKATLFGSQVAAGEYTFSDVFSYHVFYEYYYKLFGSADENFGTFKVEPGKITDLGTIIYYRKPDGDRYYTVLARKSNAGDTLTYIKNELPELVAGIDQQNILGWDEDDREYERHETFLNVAQNPTTYTGLFPQPDGSLVLTCPLGMLQYRDASGNWTIEGLNTDYSLTAYSKNALGNEMTADGAGNIFVRSSADSDWKPIAKPDAKGDLASAHLNNNNEIIVIYSNKTGLTINTLSSPDETVWERRFVYKKLEKQKGWISDEAYSREYEVAKTTWSPKNAKKPSRKIDYDNFNAVQHKDHLLLSLEKNLYQIDLDTIRITKKDIKQSSSRIGKKANDQLYTNKYSSWSGAAIVNYSLDDGTTWHAYSKKIDRCPDKAGSNKRCPDGKARIRIRSHVGIPIFYKDGTAYSIVKKKDRSFWKSEVETTYHLVVSENGGKYWRYTENSEPPKYCNTLYKGTSEDEILLGCVTGAFYKTDKHSIDWQLDHQPALF